MAPLNQADRVRALALDHRNQFAKSPLHRAPFHGRGFSDRVIDALVASGVDAPERLLFLKRADIQKIAGIGPKGRGELEAYRGRFLGRSADDHADHPKPTGPATDAFAAMEDAVKQDRGGSARGGAKRAASIKKTGEELPQEQWERFEAAAKKPKP